MILVALPENSTFNERMKRLLKGMPVIQQSDDAVVFKAEDVRLKRNRVVNHVVRLAIFQLAANGQVAAQPALNGSEFIGKRLFLRVTHGH